ncbi:MAG: leucyl/phenylalanyl-tRNA--protein transferase [Burkholderiaceae bacterium]|nr:MAG: leucyl/phenylalanyl-tRNA--protein transferase [Burkholderiaceae bacterium]
MRPPQSRLAWLAPGAPFPSPDRAWGELDPVPGLLAGGGALDAESLVRAYSQGIFPWFSEDQPILWWSPEPRMVLRVGEFKLHRSLCKTLQHFHIDPRCEIRIDSAFSQVIRACSTSLRAGQSGTWIVPPMVQAYEMLHNLGLAHSVEVWVDGQLNGGLYCVALGKAVFGESMFTRAPNASKIALAALVCFCRHYGIELIDCQQKTGHLASLGAREVTRASFVEQVAHNVALTAPRWQFEHVYWRELLPVKTVPA